MSRRHPAKRRFKCFAFTDYSLGQFPGAATFVLDHKYAARFVDDAGFDEEVHSAHVAPIFLEGARQSIDRAAVCLLATANSPFSCPSQDNCHPQGVLAVPLLNICSLSANDRDFHARALFRRASAACLRRLVAVLERKAPARLCELDAQAPSCSSGPQLPIGWLPMPPRCRPDHIAITGDLINLGLPCRVRGRTFAWLRRGRAPRDVTVVPGNHDIYSSLHGDPAYARWAEYMGGENDTLAFPFVRRVGPIALVGLNSAVETPPFYRQRQARAASARNRGGTSRCSRRGRPDPRRADSSSAAAAILRRREAALSDAAHLAHLLERGNAELVLYGHNHRTRLDWLPSRAKAGSGRRYCVGIGGDRCTAKSRWRNYNLFTFFKNESGFASATSCAGSRAPESAVKKISETVLERAASDV